MRERKRERERQREGERERGRLQRFTQPKIMPRDCKENLWKAQKYIHYRYVGMCR